MIDVSMLLENFVSSFIQSQTRWKQHSIFSQLIHDYYLFLLQPSIECEISTEDHHCHVSCLSLDKVDNRFLLSGGINGSISVYDLEKYSFDTSSAQRRKKVIPLKTKIRNKSMISSVSWFPNDSGLFLTSSYDGSVLLYDTNQFMD